MYRNTHINITLHFFKKNFSKLNNSSYSLNTATSLNNYEQEVLSFSDYYAGGFPLPGRHTVQTSSDYDANGNRVYRYGAFGHEKIDEVSGSGNTVDMGDRWLDVRLGRTAKPDKQAHKYPFISPYSYALNSPILFIDPDGEDVVVAFGGLDYNNSGDAGSALKLVNDLKVWAEANNIEDFDAEAFASDWIDNAQDKAVKFIEDNYSKGEKIIIYGYSWGGDNAVELTETLKEKGYEVDLLIMVDAAKGPLSGDLGDWVDREIPDNTKEATNYYQKNPSKVRSHGNEAKAKDPKKTSVMNVEVTTEGISHSNIDEEVAPLVKEEIKNKVNE